MTTFKRIGPFLLLPLVLWLYSPLACPRPAQRLEIAPGESSFEYAQRIKKELNKIIDLQPEQYMNQVDRFRSIIEKFVEKKKRDCRGELSPKKRLTREEKNLCYKEIKTFQIAFVQNMFAARKKFLTHTHEKRLKELEKTKERVIKKLRSRSAFTSR